jgi:RND family efflux transporter MFP subunit
MKSQLAKTISRAPFSGIVDKVITDQGSVVSPGQELFRIVNLSNMYIQADIPEKYIKSVVPGKDVSIEFPILGQTIDTKIRQTGNYINPNNRSFSIEVGVPNNSGNIKPNLTAKLKINDYTNESTILIPINVISENAKGEQYVYKVVAEEGASSKNIKAKRQIIKTGLSQNGLIEVVEGLANGESIVVEGARSVKDGQQIKILNY